MPPQKRTSCMFQATSFSLWSAGLERTSWEASFLGMQGPDVLKVIHSTNLRANHKQSAQNRYDESGATFLVTLLHKCTTVLHQVKLMNYLQGWVLSMPSISACVSCCNKVLLTGWWWDISFKHLLFIDHAQVLLPAVGALCMYKGHLSQPVPKKQDFIEI